MTAVAEFVADPVADAADLALAEVWQEVRSRLLAPPPLLTVSEWADRYRVVPSYSAEPGRWVTEKTPYLREPMDSFSDPSVNKVVVMKCARIGATEAGLNVIGYFIHQDPSPVFIVQPTVDDAKDFSKEQLTPTIEETEELRTRVSGPGAKDSGNTILAKLFPGGALYLVGANSPRGFRRRTARVVVLEEVDGYPPSAGTEGDQVKLAERRATTYMHRRKVYLNSTPTLKGSSRIADEFALSDQRRYHVPCPYCGHAQVLHWGDDKSPYGVKWEAGHPETAAYLCAGCATLIPEREKFGMVARGTWVATNPGPATRGYHLNALYSPWVSWAELAAEREEAKGDIGKLQVFVNTALGEPWEDLGGAVALTALFNRRGDGYPALAEVPAGVGLLTCGVDVQADRLVVRVRGWGAGEETWGIHYDQIPGDTSGPAVWALLDELLLRPWTREGGGTMTIHTACIDSGFNAEMVHRFCKPRYGRRVFATRGSSQPGRPLVNRRPTANNKARCRVFYVGPDTAKDLLFGRLKVTLPGPGFWHFERGVDASYFEELTSEKRTRVQLAGRWVSRYAVLPNRENHALDCEVLNVVAVQLSGVSLTTLGARAEAATATAPAAEAPAVADAPSAPDALPPEIVPPDPTPDARAGRARNPYDERGGRFAPRWSR